ncbi:RNA-directed RNA polymerase [Sarracenia purpurea var. burkii]
MSDPSREVPLPPSVESMLRRICAEQCQSPPDTSVRKTLERLGEERSLRILTTISTKKIYKTLSGFIIHMANGYLRVPTEESVCQSPQKRNSSSSPVKSPIESACFLGKFSGKMNRQLPSGSLFHPVVVPTGIFMIHGGSSPSPMLKRPICSASSERASTQKISPQLLALSELEFRKAFLILSYIGRNKLEDLMSAQDILGLKNLPMGIFEAEVWDAYGKRYCDETDRRKKSA